MNRLLKHIQADWDSLKDKHERQIIESYAQTGKLVTIILTRKNKMLLTSHFLYTKFYFYAILFIYVKLIYYYYYYFINRTRIILK